MFVEFKVRFVIPLPHSFYNNTPPYALRHVLEEGCGDSVVLYSGDSKLNGGQGLWSYSTHKEQRNHQSGRLREEASLSLAICQCHHWVTRCVCGFVCMLRQAFVRQ